MIIAPAWRAFHEVSGFKINGRDMPGRFQFAIAAKAYSAACLAAPVCADER